MATVLSGLTEGDFTALRVVKQGTLQDVLDLIAAGGSGSSSGGVVSSVTAPLSVDGQGVLSIDLSSITAQLANKLDSLAGAGGIVVSGSGSSRTITVDLSALATTAALSAGLAGKEDTISLTASRALVSTGLGGLAASQTTAQELSYLNLCTGNVQTQLNQKQGTLSVGAGAFLSGSTLSGYDLRWAVNNVPSLSIRCLHFKSGFAVAESFNLASGQTEMALEPDYTAVQAKLTSYSEAPQTTTIIQKSDELASPPTYLPWPGFASSVSNNAGFQTLSFGSGLYDGFTNLPTSGTMTFEMQLRSGSVSGAGAMVFSVNDATAANWVDTIFNLGSTFQTYTYSLPLFPNGNMNYHAGFTFSSSSLVQPSGTVDLRYFCATLVSGGASASISVPLSVAGDLTIAGVASATSFTSTSDEAIKNDVRDASVADCMAMLKAVDAKTYNRTDVPGSRLGFIAQDIDAMCPPEWGNLVQMQFGGESPLLSLSYERLVCVLWGVCKNQEARITALESGEARQPKPAKAKQPKPKPSSPPSSS